MRKQLSYLAKRQMLYRRKREASAPKFERATVKPTLAPVAHSSSLFGLAAKHGPWCVICGLPCDFHSARRTRITATREHLIPRSKGGIGGDNLRISHDYCNAKRGNREIDAGLKQKCREWILRNIGVPRLLDAESHFNAHVRPQIVDLIRRSNASSAAVDEYMTEYAAKKAANEDVFWRCNQGGLCSGR